MRPTRKTTPTALPATVLPMEKIVGMLNVDITKSNGTNYDEGLEYAYHLGMAIQQKNIAEGQDRDLVVIFLSDGAPMQFNYFSGRTVMGTWPDWFNGNADGHHAPELFRGQPACRSGGAGQHTACFAEGW